MVVALMMLMTMTLGSCKMSNKSATTEEQQDSIPACMGGIAGLEKYQTKMDYSKDENWLEKPEKATKSVDVFYIYPTVTGFRDPVQHSSVLRAITSTTTASSTTTSSRTKPTASRHIWKNDNG